MSNKTYSIQVWCECKNCSLYIDRQQSHHFNIPKGLSVRGYLQDIECKFCGCNMIEQND